MQPSNKKFKIIHTSVFNMAKTGFPQ